MAKQTLMLGYWIPEWSDVKGLFPDEDHFKLHLNLYKNYIKKVDDEGDNSDFQVGGKLLHHLYFEQFKQLPQFKKPYGMIKDFIEKHFETYDKFIDAFTDEAKNFHGSGWIYLSKSGKIKTIKNHKPVKDVIIILDIWEHAWQASDSPKDKDKYLKNFWKYLAWDLIQSRLPLVESQTMRYLIDIIE